MAPKKSLEESNPESCWNRAKPDEAVFVLLGRDACAPGAVRDWCARRIAAGKNKPDDPQITEAFWWATRVEQEQRRAESECSWR